jgi:AbrB family looped-hinge helix DNA binding protein
MHVRIGDKGQVQIPLGVRQTLGVGPGDKLLFEVKGRTVRVRSVKSASRFARYRGIGNPGRPEGRKNIIKWIREARGR